MRGRFSRRNALSAAASIAVVAVSTAVIRIIDAAFEPQHLIFGYLIPTTFIAFRFGSVPAMLTAMASSICAAFILYPPKFSIYISNPLHVAELMFFFVLSIATTQFISVLADEKQRNTPHHAGE